MGTDMDGRTTRCGLVIMLAWTFLDSAGAKAKPLESVVSPWDAPMRFWASPASGDYACGVHAGRVTWNQLAAARIDWSGRKGTAGAISAELATRAILKSSGYEPKARLQNVQDPKTFDLGRYLYGVPLGVDELLGMLQCLNSMHEPDLAASHADAFRLVRLGPGSQTVIRVELGARSSRLSASVLGSACGREPAVICDQVEKELTKSEVSELEACFADDSLWNPGNGGEGAPGAELWIVEMRQNGHYQLGANRGRPLGAMKKCISRFVSLAGLTDSLSSAQGGKSQSLGADIDAPAGQVSGSYNPNGQDSETSKRSREPRCDKLFGTNHTILRGGKPLSRYASDPSIHILDRTPMSKCLGVMHEPDLAQAPDHTFRFAWLGIGLPISIRVFPTDTGSTLVAKVLGTSCLDDPAVLCSRVEKRLSKPEQDAVEACFRDPSVWSRTPFNPRLRSDAKWIVEAHQGGKHQYARSDDESTSPALHACASLLYSFSGLPQSWEYR